MTHKWCLVWAPVSPKPGGTVFQTRHSSTETYQSSKDDFPLTNEHRSDVDVQAAFGLGLQLQSRRMETAGCLLLPGHSAGPGLNKGLPAYRNTGSKTSAQQTSGVCQGTLFTNAQQGHAIA